MRCERLGFSVASLLYFAVRFLPAAHRIRHVVNYVKACSARAQADSQFVSASSGFRYLAVLLTTGWYLMSGRTPKVIVLNESLFISAQRWQLRAAPWVVVISLKGSGMILRGFE